VYIGNALLVAAFLVYKVVNSEARADLDRLTAISVSFALEFVLLMTIARQARNLRKLGYDHHALQQGFAAILEEGDEARAQALAVPGIARKRRIRNFMVLPLILLGIYDVNLGYAKRVAITEGYYSMSRAGATVLIAGICSIVVGILIVFLDPFRRPILQRLGSAFWGGPIGALLMGSPKGGAAPTGTTKPPTTITAVVTPLPVGRPGSPVVSGDRLTKIERRLDALERK
jgi:hypothetical protein